MKVFPGLIAAGVGDAAERSATHIRYPQDLFEVQRALLAQYHVDDPVTFYNVQDKWTVPDGPGELRVEPAAVLRAGLAAGRAVDQPRSSS